MLRWLCETTLKLRLFLLLSPGLSTSRTSVLSLLIVPKVQQYQKLVVDDTLAERRAFLSNCFDFTVPCSLQNYSGAHSTVWLQCGWRAQFRDRVHEDIALLSTGKNEMGVFTVSNSDSTQCLPFIFASCKLCGNSNHWVCCMFDGYTNFSVICVKVCKFDAYWLVWWMRSESWCYGKQENKRTDSLQTVTPH